MTEAATIGRGTPTSTVDLRSITPVRPAALPQGRRLQIAWDPATRKYRLAMSP